MTRIRIAGGVVLLALVAGMLGLGVATTSATGVVGTAAPSTAAPAAAQSSPYPRSVRTKCRARLVGKKGRALGPRQRVFRPYRTIRVRYVIRHNSTGKPKGKVRAKKFRGKRHAQVKRSIRRYRGQPVVWRYTSGLQRGRYRLVFRTKFGPKSRFRNTSCAVKYRVKKPRRPGNGPGGNGPGGGVS